MSRSRPGVVSLLGSWLIRGWYRSLRLETVAAEPVWQRWQQGQGLIMAFWHDQLLMMPPFYQGSQAHILVSRSRDGELMARTLQCFGLQTVRGSSSRGGSAGLRQLATLCRQQGDIVVTPDGPRGPRHQLKPGLGYLSRLGQRHGVALAFACHRGRRLGSWDRMLIPAPGTRGVFAFSDIVSFKGRQDNREMETVWQQLLNQANERACQALEARGVSAL